jgi:hypothetical protein
VDALTPVCAVATAQAPAEIRPAVDRATRLPCLMCPTEAFLPACSGPLSTPKSEAM